MKKQPYPREFFRRVHLLSPELEFSQDSWSSSSDYGP